jgi:hypothetical protein
MAEGKLEALLAGREIDLGTTAQNRQLLAGAKLKTKAKLVPTLAPFLTGRPGAGGGTEVKMGQVLLEIETLDGTDKFRMAIDLKGSVSFALVADEPLLPIFQPPQPLSILQIRVHDLEALGADVVHTPKTTSPFFGDLFLNNFLPQVPLQQLVVEYPLPDFGDLGLTLLGLDAKPDGGVVVFGNLDLNAPGGGSGPVLGGGVLAQP